MGKPTVSNSGETIATKATPHAAIATAPDTCKTPGPPVPFPNFVKSEQLVNGTVTATIAGAPVWTSVGELTPSLPPHPQVGVKSGTTGKEATAAGWSRDVFCEGNPVVRNADATWQNHKNTSGMVVLVPDGADLAAMAADAIGGDRGVLSHPVDVVTGRAYTLPITDLELPGRLPLLFARSYSSSTAHRDIGLGRGWSHSYGDEMVIHTRGLTLWTGDGLRIEMGAVPRRSGQVIAPGGWLLSRSERQFVLVDDEGTRRLFEPVAEDAVRHRLAAVEDYAGNRVVLSYEGARLAALRDDAGRTVHLRRAPSGRIAALEVRGLPPDERQIVFARYAYDADGRLISVTDADGYTHLYAYDAHHRLTSDSDRTGLTFHFVYDREGRCIESWGDYPGARDPSLADGLPFLLADGFTPVKGIQHTKIDYAGDGSAVATTASQRSSFAGNQHGTLDRSVEGGRATSRRYREDGQLVARTDPAGATIAVERDPRGRLLEITDPLGRVTRIERDSAGAALKQIDPDGGVSTFSYDERGDLMRATTPGGAATSYTWNERGLLSDMVFPNGAALSVEWDAQGNPVATRLPGGSTARFSYDGFGRLASFNDALGHTTRYAYSDRGDLIRVDHADGGTTRYEYDGERRPMRRIDPRGRVNEAKWAGMNQLYERRDPNGATVSLRYDWDGRLCHVINQRGETQTFMYDAAGDLVEERAFDGRCVRYQHDACGRVNSVEDDLGQRTEIRYDAAGRIVAREFSDGAVETFAYDAAGRLTTATTLVTELRFVRDADGRVVREIQRVGGREHWVAVKRDANGDRIARRTSLGHRERIERNACGMPARTVLDDGCVIVHRWDAVGREIGLELSTSGGVAGGRIETAFDAMGRLSQRSVTAVSPSPQLVLETRYRHEAGDLVETTDAARGVTRYRHDPAGHLTAVEREDRGAERFDYDPAGNVVAWDGEPLVYGAGNRLLQKGKTELVWDRAGRIIEKRIEGGTESWRYDWSVKGLLERVTAPNGTVVELCYDAFARRVAKLVTPPGGEPTATRFIWDGDTLVHEIVERPAAPVSERTYCFHETSWAPLAHRDERDGPWFFYVNDRAGAPDRLVAQDGAVAADLEREVWGRMETAAARTTTPLRFQGQYEDEETGLVYNRARYYDPDCARYISADPIGLLGGLNEFSYGRSPLTSIDPLGTDDSEVIRRGFTYTEPTGYYSDGTNIRTAEFCTAPGLFTFGTHGSPNGMDIGGVHVTDAVKTAAHLRRIGNPGGKYYKAGMPIRLTACSTGRGGKNSIAAKLALEMGVAVSAPTGDLNAKSGAIAIDPTTGKPGVWLTFTPKPDGTVTITPTGGATSWKPGCSYD